MGVLWSKVWSDLWHHKTRTVLAVLSIAAGVFAVGTIFGMVDQLLSGMDRAHRAVSPSHINIILRGLVDEEIVADLRGLNGVLDIEPVNQVPVRYRTDPDSAWKLGMLVMRADYDNQTYDTVTRKDGSWPAAGRIGVERLTGQHYGIAVGDTVTFEIGGEQYGFEVGGTVRHPFVQPPLFGGQGHFFADSAGLAEIGIPEGRYGQLLVQVAPYSQEFAQEVAGDIRLELAHRGVGVIVMLYQEPDAHWGRMFVEGVTVVMQIMAVVSLFLSVILVLTTTTAMITQQTDQIGILKAVGARASTIFQIYLTSVLALGIAALLIALPLGALTAYAASRWFLNVFNIDYEVFRLSTRGVALQIGAALAAPLMAASWPIWKGARLTVREAIATYGIGADFGSSRLDRLVERTAAGILPTPYATALGNMLRRKERLLLTVLVLVTAGVMYIVTITLVSSTTLTLDNEMARRGYDVRIGFTDDQPVETIVPLVESVGLVERAEMWSSRNATLLRDGERLEDSAGLGAQLLGIPIGSPMLRPIIAAGRWLEPGDDRAVVVSKDTADLNGIAVGEVLTLDLGLLGESDWRVVGIYKVIYNGGFVTESLYAPLDAVLAVTGRPGIGTQVLVQAQPGARDRASVIADDLRTALDAEHIGVDLYTTSVRTEERAHLENQFNTVISMLLGLAMLVATVGAIGLTGSLSIGVLERRREIGVMRAIGARSRTVLALFVLEGSLQAVLSWLIAVPVAFVVSQPLARLLGQTMMDVDLDYRFSLPAVAIWLAAVLLISALASLGPARAATRISVRQSLAYA